ncbi:hypothetical protein CABS01_02955 [Colletotrichum abscissum]|uniref:uncharacterized protein n=1 Tax=Colletotrichum abscissum TaxID=1671311 RepID=UPI0027D4A902|nr:uncharacterized protein CABS01_02955 [Colletotrichum abscissum]KAK1483219.1 hypothetical protein CABS01_02955 [Colletotrichum abscissum]
MYLLTYRICMMVILRGPTCGLVLYPAAASRTAPLRGGPLVNASRIPTTLAASMTWVGWLWRGKKRKHHFPIISPQRGRRGAGQARLELSHVARERRRRGEIISRQCEAQKKKSRRE